MTDCEEWRPVVGFEGSYEVSSLGRVRSLDRVVVQRSRWGGMIERKLRGQIIRAENKGYPHVRMGYKHYAVHILVAEAFIGPRPEGKQVCHNDGNVTNARLSNLRYDTPLENSTDRYAHGTILLGGDHPNAKLSTEDVFAIRRLCRERASTQRDIAAQFGIGQQQVSRINTGARWRHV